LCTNNQQRKNPGRTQQNNCPKPLWLGAFWENKKGSRQGGIRHGPQKRLAGKTPEKMNKETVTPILLGGLVTNEPCPKKKEKEKNT